MAKITMTKEEILKLQEGKEPIYKGCLAAEYGGCFCTGACKEIIGWKEKDKFGKLK